MDTSAVAVLVGGIVLIGLILWYFFGARDDTGNAPRSDGGEHHR